MVLRKPELTGRLAKWSVRLSLYDIVYEPRTAIKSQVLADFVADFSPSLLAQVDEELQCMMSKTETKPWSLFTDGASNVNGTGLGLVLKLPQGDIMAHAICCDFKATNNEAEYEALIIGLTTARDLKVTHIDVNCDSLLIINHVNGTYEAKDYKMLAYLNIVKELQAEFDSFNIQQVPRESNTQADALAGLGAIFRHINLTNIPIIHVLKPATEKLDNNKDVLSLDNTVDDNTQQSTSWTHTIKDYLTNDVQLVNNNEAKIF